jgi:hypothetical protein
MPTAAPVKETETAKGHSPVQTFRARGVSAAIFENRAKSEGRDSTFFKVSVQRTYREGKDFKHTTSFGRDDLPHLRRVVNQAWEYIVDAEAARGKEDAE